MTRRLKLCLMCLLLTGAIFSLAAQTGQTVVVYMPLVTGTGIDEYDNNYFYMLMYYEMEAQSFIRMGVSASSSDYSLVGALLPMGMDATSSFLEYRFDLYLQNNRTGELMSEQRYRYSNLDSVDIVIQRMLGNVFNLIRPPPPPAPPPPAPTLQPVQPAPPPPSPQSVLPFQLPVPQPPASVPEPVQPTPQPVVPAPQPAAPGPQPAAPGPPVLEPVLPVPQPDPPVPPGSEGDWREKTLFAGISGFWTPRLYGGLDQVNLLNFGLGLYAEFRILESVALETGLGLGSDYIDKNYQDFMLEVPLLVKIVIRPGDVYLLEPYAGVCFNLPLIAAGVKPALLSLSLGYQHGVKAGPGAFLFDFRFSMDMSASIIVDRPDLPPYQRYSFSFGIGYKYGVSLKP